MTAIAVCSLLAGVLCFASLADAAVLKPFSALVMAQSLLFGTMLVAVAKRSNNVGKSWTYGLMTEAAVLFTVGTLIG